MSAEALVYYSIDATSGFSAVSDLCNYLSQNFSVDRFSSVFKRKHSFQGEVSSEFCGVLLLSSTKKSSEEFTASASILMLNYPNRRNLQQFVLLSHGDEVKFTPYGPLPHPQLLQDQLILICAAEIAESWVHPVTRSQLGELLSKQEMSVSAEFIAQGKTLGLEAS